jgi:serine O-acetyltransferase
MCPPVLLYRLGNAVHRLRIPFIPKMITGLNRLLFACYLPSTASLGKGVVLAYWGLGTVIHAASKIGDRTLIRQNVTIGTRHKGGGVPTIGADCFIGAGAVILGAVNIGDRAIIGANSVVTHDVPTGATVVGVPARPLNKSQL